MPLPTTNKRIVLAKRPGRGPVTDETFKLDVEPLRAPKEGEVVVKVEYTSTVSISVDPRMCEPGYLVPITDGSDRSRSSEVDAKSKRTYS